MQLGIFLFTYTVLLFAVFKPFTAAYEERLKRTKGSEEEVADFAQKRAELYAEYEVRARDVNNQIRTIYDDYRHEANKEYAKIVDEAKKQSAGIVETIRQKISSEIKLAQGQIKDQAPALAKQIANKLLKKA